MNIKTHQFFILRRPLLSMQAYYDFQKKISENENALELGLKTIFSDPILQQGIYLASPQLHDLMLAFLGDEPIGNKKKVIYTLYKYLIRSATRCTPFGLFAGYFPGSFKEVTHVRFPKTDRLICFTKADMQLAYELTSQIISNEPLADTNSKYFPNTSLYRVAGYYRYLYREVQGAQTDFILSEINADVLLEKILSFARNGATPAELIDILLKEKINQQQAYDWIADLIQAQLLVSSHMLNITGEDFIERFVRTFQSHHQSRESEILKTFQNFLLKPEAIEKQHTKLKDMLQKAFPSFSAKNLIRADVRFKTESCTLSQRVISLILKDMQELSPLMQKPSFTDLDNFASALYERYGQKKVPLLQALDFDYGVGYGALKPGARGIFPLLEGLQQNPAKISKEQKVNRFAQEAYQKALSNNEWSIRLTESILAEHSVKAKDNFPSEFYLFGSILARTEKEMDQGYFNFEFKGMGGPSSLNLISRLSSSDKQLAGLLKQATGTQQTALKDAVYAEISHFPGFKEANILARAEIRAYEIPYLSISNKDLHFQITPDDLMINSDGKQLLLTSKRLERHVIPMLTSAHDYRNGLPLYRFLCEFSQHSAGAYLHWDWGSLSQMPRLPRVSYKHWILSKACWNLDKTVLEEFIETTAEPVAAWQKISRKLSIPRYFQIGEADHQLLIDAKSIPAMVLLKEFAKKNGRIILTEYLQGSRSWLRDQGQAIANEIIIPFKAASSQNRLGPSYTKQKATAQQNAGVDFSVGSQWLYVKIYCSQGNSDQILETYIAPLCNTLIESKQIEKWFFVRYQDPAPHLRIRFFHGSSPDFWILVLSRLHPVMAQSLREQSVSKMQIETYQRELERYHMLDYDAVESLFFYDSIFVSHALPLLRQNIDPDTYWLAALRSADELFSALGLDLGSKIELVKKLHKTLAEELDTAEDLVVMDHNYRLEKTKISAVMSDSASLLSDDARLSKLFEDRTKAFGLILQHHHKLDLPARQELTAHLIHMHLNRWFSAEQRRQELVIYHYLEKFYDSAWKYYQHLKISV